MQQEQTDGPCTPAPVRVSSARPASRRWWIALCIVAMVCLIAGILCVELPWRYYRAETLNAEWVFHKLAITEPSALAFHPQRGTLFAASDEGYVLEMDRELHILNRYTIPGDLEGLSVHPITGTLFVAVESCQGILEYDLDQKRVLRMILVDLQALPEFAHKPIQGNRGLEGVMIVKDENAGLVLMAVVESDPARLLQLQADLSPEATEQARSRHSTTNMAGVLQTSTVTKVFDVGAPRISDVTWSRDCGCYLVLCSADRVLALVDTEGEVLESVRVPGHCPEGFVILEDGQAYLVDDAYGGIWVSPDFERQLRLSFPRAAPVR